MPDLALERQKPAPSPAGTHRERELAAEQGYIDWAYSCLSRMIERVRTMVGPSSPKAGAAMVRHKRARLEAWREAENALVIGRIDCVDDETWYVGKAHVDGDDTHKVAVVDWRAPIAERFYQASRSNPQGVGRRRTFRMRGRQLLDISEERLMPTFTPPDAAPTVVPPPVVTPRPRLLKPKRSAPPPQESPAAVAPTLSTPRSEDLEVELRAGDLVLDELARERTGKMREVVATIQADQDRLVRAPLEGVLVIQGAPGTGKTVVGLHRAAYVLYRQREDSLHNSVLVLGPNRAFLSYIRGVLPSLGENHATQVTLAELAMLDLPQADRGRVQVRAVDSDAAAALKGDLRISTVVRRAVWAQAKPQPLTIVSGRYSIELDRSAVEAQLREIGGEGVPYRAARDRLRSRLESAVSDLVAQRAGLQLNDRAIANDGRQVVAALREELRSSRFLEAVLPEVNARVIVERLLTESELLASAAQGTLGSAQQRVLLRRRPKSGQFPWSDADLPLVGEAMFAIAGRSQTFGHIVVDEAQDLSPMQWRILLRRSGRRSMTILGDLAQATGSHAPTSWLALLDELGLGESASVVELGIGYRVPKPIIEFACQLLPAAAPDVTVPLSIRGGDEPAIRRVSRGQLIDAIVEAIGGHRSGQTAVVVPSARRDEVGKELRSLGMRVGEPMLDGLAESLVLLTADEAKGLEFDHVIVIEPRAISGRTKRGLRLLYIALTRATKQLTILHSEPLPRALSGLSGLGATEQPGGAVVDDQIDEPAGGMEDSAPPGDAGHRDRVQPADVAKADVAAASREVAELEPDEGEHVPGSSSGVDVRQSRLRRTLTRLRRRPRSG